MSYEFLASSPHFYYNVLTLCNTVLPFMVVLKKIAPCKQQGFAILTFFTVTSKLLVPFSETKFIAFLYKSYFILRKSGKG